MHKSFLAVVFLAFCPFLAAQLSPRNEDIVKMVKAGLGEDLIITTVNASPGYYDTSAAGLVALKAAGVTDREMSAIVHKAFQICFAGIGQDQPQSLSFPEMVKMLQDTGCGPRHSAALPSAGLPDPAAQAPAQQSPPEARSGNKPRVFLTLANMLAGQSAPLNGSIQPSRDFAQNCPGAQVTMDRNVADYTVSIDPIGGGATQSTRILIANRKGNLLSIADGGKMIDGAKKACNAILEDWASK